MIVTQESFLLDRKNRKLSREDYAKFTGLTPGAVWRIETKGVFKPGELERVEAAWGQDHDMPKETTVPPVPMFSDPPEAVEIPVPKFPKEQSTSDSPAPPPVPTWSLDEMPETMHVMSTQQATDMVDQVNQHTNTLLSDLYKRVHDRELVTVNEKIKEAVSHIDDVVKELSPRELQQIDGIRRIGNSEIQTFKNCRRKWYLTYYRNLAQKQTSVLGVLNTGLRIHRALQEWYVPEGSKRKDPVDALEFIIGEDLLTLEKASGGDVPPEVIKSFNNQVMLERIMMQGYVEWLEETGSDSEIIVTGSEQYIEADIADNVRYVGRIDARVKRKHDGARLFWDHKTVGSFDTRMLPLSEQMLGYMLLESLQQDDSPNTLGALYNMLRRVKRTEKAKPPFYLRVEVRHNQLELNNYQQRINAVISDIQDVEKRLDAGVDHREAAYPSPGRDCTWSCPFLSVCGMMDDGSRVEDAIANLYVINDPYAYYVKHQEPQELTS